MKSIHFAQADLMSNGEFMARVKGNVCKSDSSKKGQQSSPSKSCQYCHRTGAGVESCCSKNCLIYCSPLCLIELTKNVDILASLSTCPVNCKERALSTIIMPVEEYFSDEEPSYHDIARSSPLLLPNSLKELLALDPVSPGAAPFTVDIQSMHGKLQVLEWSALEDTIAIVQKELAPHLLSLRAEASHVVVVRPGEEFVSRSKQVSSSHVITLAVEVSSFPVKSDDGDQPLVSGTIANAGGCVENKVAYWAFLAGEELHIETPSSQSEHLVLLCYHLFAQGAVKQDLFQALQSIPCFQPSPPLSFRFWKRVSPCEFRVIEELIAPTFAAEVKQLFDEGNFGALLTLLSTSDGLVHSLGAALPAIYLQVGKASMENLLQSLGKTTFGFVPAISYLRNDFQNIVFMGRDGAFQTCLQRVFSKSSSEFAPCLVISGGEHSGSQIFRTLANDNQILLAQSGCTETGATESQHQDGCNQLVSTEVGTEITPFKGLHVISSSYWLKEVVSTFHQFKREKAALGMEFEWHLNVVWLITINKENHGPLRDLGTSS
jgi:hypothetical protein